MTQRDQTPRRGFIDRFLTIVEKAGNALPHPATLFASFAAMAVLASWLFSKLGLTAVHPKDGSTVEIVNLVSQEGLHWFLENTITNYTGFAPLGTVMVALLVIAVPFALQMRKGYERSKDATARDTAKMFVDSIMRFLEASLTGTTDRVESANRSAGRKVPNDFAALKSDDEFLNNLSYITAESVNFLAHYRNMLERTRAVEAAIARELERLASQ